MFLLYPKLNDLPMKISRRRSTEVIANQGFFNMRLLSFQQLKAIIVIMKFCQKISMTRFGEILPLWQKFTSLWQKFDSLFLFGKMLSLLWQICDIVGLIFSVPNSQTLKKKSNHLVTRSMLGPLELESTTLPTDPLPPY